MPCDDIADRYRRQLGDICDQGDRLAELADRVAEAVETGDLSAEDARQALQRLVGAARPAEPLRALLGLVGRPSGRQALSKPGALDIFLTLAAQGVHPAKVLQRHPSHLVYLADIAPDHAGRSAQQLRSDLDGHIAGALADGRGRQEAVFGSLRWLKRRETLRIYLREVAHASSLRQTTAEIARVAQVCLQAACEHGAHAVGEPELTEHFCVLGMGKLGGAELNFSSDIDLIYICSDAVGQRPELAQKIDPLARWITQALGQMTADGYVFRVDLRLRPDGSKGQLVHSVAAMIDYYLNWGQTWERSAMVKARPVAGETAIGHRLLAELEPFLYRRYLDFAVLDDLRAMKAQIDHHARASAVVGLDRADDHRRGVERRDVARLAGSGGQADHSPRGHDKSNHDKSGHDKSGHDTSNHDTSNHDEQASSPFQDRLRRKFSSTPARARRRRGRAGRLRLSGTSEPSADASSAKPTPEGATSDGATSEGAVDANNPRQLPADAPYGWDVKIGVGGIREIEFFVQALQLIHCGTRETLRVRGTLDALDRLLYAGLISHDDHAVLADGYDLFRRVEHRVQMERDRQLHRLPRHAPAFEALARRMFTEPDDLRERLAYFRRHVAAIFNRLFDESAQTTDRPTVGQSRPSELATVLGVNPDDLLDPAVIAALETLGFGRPRQVAGQLQMLGHKRAGPFGRHANTDHRELSRYVLQACATAPDPDQAFSYWTRLSSVIGDRPGVYDMLVDNPHATRLLIHVFGSSEFLAAIVIREPNVIDYLLGASTVAVVRERAEMARELGRRLAGIDDPSHRLGRVRRFHQEEILRIALHEIAGACDIDQTVRQVSMLAEVVIDAVLAEVFQNLVNHADVDPDAIGRLDELDFSVLGVGKLGGRELSFGSDLDVIFVYESADVGGLDHGFFARLAQRLVRNLSSVSAHGKLYDVDTRLRPSGRQGTLVVSFEAFGAYHRDRADLWERQALIRARPLTGSDAFRTKLMGVRRQLAFDRAIPADLAKRMRQMRQKMGSADAGSAAGFDIKTGPGGLIDCEFLVQYLQLVNAPRQGDAGADDLGADQFDEKQFDEKQFDEKQFDEKQFDEKQFDEKQFDEKQFDATQQARGLSVVDGLRSQSTTRALAGLADAQHGGGVDVPVDCLQLIDDYRWLRRVEVRLRMSDQRGPNRLPGDHEQRAILARRLGYQGSGAGRQLRQEMDAVTGRIKAAFDRVIGRPT